MACRASCHEFSSDQASISNVRSTVIGLYRHTALKDQSVMQASIFVVDDQPAFRRALEKLLSRMQHRVRTFESGDDLLSAVEEDMPDVILLDLKMPGLSGIETLEALHSKSCDALVVLLTAYGTVEDAVEAMKLGAFDFLIKTIDLESLEPVVNRALEHVRLKRRVAYDTEHEAQQYTMDNLVALSPAMKALLIQVREVAKNPTIPILLMVPPPMPVWGPKPASAGSVARASLRCDSNGISLVMSAGHLPGRKGGSLVSWTKQKPARSFSTKSAIWTIPCKVSS